MGSRFAFALGLLCAAAALAEKPRVAVLNLVPSDPSLERLSETLSETLTTELGRAGTLEPIGSADLMAVLGLERQKQLLGCDANSTQCFAEVSAALGAPWLVSGALQRVGRAYRVDLKLIRSRDARAVFRDGLTVTEESELFAVVSALAKKLADSPALASETPLTPTAAVVAAGPSPRVGPWLTVGAGALTLVAGAIFTVLAASEWGQLHDTSWRAQHLWQEIESTGGAYSRDIVLGPSLLGVGAALVAGGLLWWRLGAPEPAPRVVVAPAPGGVFVRGVW